MREFLELQVEPEAPAVVAKQPERWWQGHLCLFTLLIVTLLGVPFGHGMGFLILSLPVLIFLSEGFQHPEQEDATRRAALEAFAKGAILGPPLLAVAEACLGLLVALVCFGHSSMEHIVISTQTQLLPGKSFSSRLFTEALKQDPVGAFVFALLSSLLVAGLCEEGFKFFVGAWQVVRFKREFARNNTLQPSVIMACVGLGLAYSESVFTLVANTNSSSSSSTYVASERVLTCFPIHVFCAVWTAKRAARQDVSWLQAVLPSALLHGVYDFGHLVLVHVNYNNRFVGLGWGLFSALISSVTGLRAV